jgi:hypothetical protein
VEWTERDEIETPVLTKVEWESDGEGGIMEGVVDEVRGTFLVARTKVLDPQRAPRSWSREQTRNPSKKWSKRT